VLYLTESDVVVGFRGVDYDHAAVARDMAAAGMPVALLTEQPVPHPLVDPGTLPVTPLEAQAGA
jgi:hypothetical protein